MKELLKAIRDSNILVEVIDGKLRVFTDEAEIHSDLIARIREKKDELIEFLNNTIVESGDGRSVAEIPAAAVQEHYPLSSSQQRLWILQQFGGIQATYNISGTYRITGPLDIKALEFSFRRMTERHEMLRTSFREDDNGQVRQFIHPYSDHFFLLDQEDHSGEIDSEEKIKQLLSEELRTPFVLTDVPLIRARLLKVADREYIFVCSLHHIAGDEWSLKILIKELLQYYTAFVNHRPNLLQPLRIQYKDYAVWQQEQIRGGVLTSDKAYWLNKLAGDLPVLALQTDHIRPVMKTYHGREFSRIIPSDMYAGIQAICRQQGATLFMGLLAVVKVFLYKYTGQTDLIVGTAVAGRDHFDLEDQIGFYVNSLALRTIFSGDDRFTDLLKTIKTTVLEGTVHQAYPFDQLIDELNHVRDLSRNPLFDIMVTLRHSDAGSDEFKGLGDDLRIGKYDKGELTTTVKFDLVFNFSESNGHLQIDMAYNTDLYEDATIGRFADHLLQLMQVMIADPAQAIGRSDFLNTADTRRLLTEFNNTGSAYSQDRTVVDLFEEQVRRAPESAALFFDGKIYSYTQINEAANQLCGYLTATYGIGGNQLVGIQLGASPDRILSILAILKLGGAYIPIDPQYPQERIAYMKADSRCSLVIDETVMQGFMMQKSAYPAENQRPVAGPGDLAYVIYTSGSTGQPKGVMVEHGSLVNLCAWHISNFSVTAKDRATLYAGVAFDASVWELFPYLITGACLYSIPADIRLNANALSAFYEANGITISFLPTQAGRQFMEVENRSLRCLLVGGDKLNSFIQQRYRVVNNYGPTENTVVATAFEIGSQTGDIPIGRPICNTRIYILGVHGELLPIGVSGEICIAGAGLARGYLHRPELTAERFVPDPFNSGERMYRTGDLGKWQADGNILFLGRLDEQVKVRGYRIEPGEIEKVMSDHPAIGSCVVQPWVDGDGEKELVAYYVSSAELGSSELRSYLGERLPSYMLPGYYIRLGSLPLTANGKIDRKGLPSPEEQGPETGGGYEAARTGTEARLVMIWEEILGRRGIGIRDNFFDRGGHSLKATRLSARIHKEFGVRLSLDELFGNAVLEQQASLISQSARTQFDSIMAVGEAVDYPLSSSQRRIWVLSQFGEGNIAYNIPGVYVLEGKVDVAALEYSFGRLLARHEILRTVFKEDEQGELRQVVQGMEETAFRIGQRDLRGMETRGAVGGPAELIRRLVEEETGRPFDLSAGPLLRAGLWRVSEDRWVLTYVMHHIIGDGWSIGILIRELLILYNAGVTGAEDPLTPLRIQYRDYASWQQAQLSSGAMDEHKGWWLRQFEGVLPVLELPGDKPRPLVKTYRGGVVGRHLPLELCGGLERLCREQGATLFMGLLATVNTLLYRYTGQQDIIVGSPTAGRGHIDLEEQIGCFINTLALRIRFSGDAGFDALLRAVRQVTLGANEHQQYPFDTLVGELDLRRDTSRNALFDVMVALQDDIDMTVGAAGEMTIARYTGMTGTISKFDLAFYFSRSDEQIALSIEYNSDIFDRSSILRLADHLERLLADIIQHPARSLYALDLVGPEEVRVLLTEFNDRGSVLPLERTITDLFEDQVTRTPEAIAVVSEERALSYAELNEQSNRLADYLRINYSTMADDLIGIRLERSEWIVIAILGVIKSGAAYVPIDPGYPQERIDHIIADSQCKLIIDAAVLKKFETGSASYNKNNIKGDHRPGDLAYVIYTSGSTGRPKGVMIEHRNTSTFIEWCKQEFDEAVFDTVLAVTSICFDLSVFELFYTLCSGRKVQVLQNALSLPRYLPGSEKLLLNTVPGVIGTLLAGNIDLGVVTVLNMAGEPVSPKHVNGLDCNRMEVRNLYGPTECTTYSTVYRISGEGPVMIGRPICNTRIYILGVHGELLPIGVSGEICIAGAGLARGYLHRPELTAERFVPDPFNSGERMYRTGDLGKWQADGNILFLGRLDEQVKVRGYRIEPGEIEKVMSDHPAIGSCVVQPWVDGDGEKELVAYYVSSAELGSSELRSYLGERLPSYMLPGYYIRLGSLPLTANGKIDRKGLPSPEEQGPETGGGYEAARTGTEARLVMIWEEILGRRGIGIRDNFFDRGGHSLKATRLSARIHKEFGVRLSLDELFGNAVLEQQASLISQSARTQFDSIMAVGEAVDYPLSSSQRRIWVLSQFGEGNIAYNIPGVYVLEGKVDVAALEYSFGRLLARHEILRTVFKEDEQGELRQVVQGMEETAFRIGQRDLRGMETRGAVGGPAELIRRLVEEETGRPFDLSAGPLLRAGLWRVSEDRWVLTYVMHHIIGDGWSIGILIRELLILYNAGVTGAEDPLTPLRIQYRDYASWQQAQLSSGAMDEHKGWWLRQFEGVLPVLELPGDKPRPLVKTYTGGLVSVMMPELLSDRIKFLCREEGATLFMGILSAVYALLYRYSGQTDIIVGSPMAGREHIDLGEQIGLYVNTLALRIGFAGSVNYKKLLESVRQMTVEAYRRQSYPFDELVEQLELPRDTGRNALFDVMVILQNNDVADTGAMDTGDLSISRYSNYEHTSSKYDLTFFAEETGNGLRISIEYNKDIYHSSTAEKLATHLIRLLDVMSADPLSPIQGLDYLGAAETRELVEGYKGAECLYGGGETLVGLFESSVVVNGDGCALVFGDRSYSYGELNEWGNRLGGYLRAVYDIGRDDLIGLKLERSDWAVISMLGILKSGAGCVPMDVSYPQERIDQMREGSGCKLVLDEAELLRFRECADLYGSEDLALINASCDLAYVIYTSGSTGEPKGCMLEHLGVINHLYSKVDLLGAGGMSVICHSSELHFVGGIWQLWGPLVTGGKVVLSDREELRDMGKLLLKARVYGAGVLEVVPSQLNEYLSYGGLPDWGGIGKLILTGEKLSPYFVEKCYKSGPQLEIINTYGQTESSDVTTFYRIPRTGRMERVFIGGSIRNMRNYILSPEGSLCPVGVVGEICTSGMGVSRGYVNNAEETGLRFVADVYGGGGRMYRTGDLGRRLPDGQLEILGRKDEQVKIRGHRIELNEIEGVLEGYSGVEEAAVLLEDTGGEKSLWAYIVSKGGLEVEGLRSYLGSRLPVYMLPSRYVEVAGLPLLGNGKIDRHSLRRMGGRELVSGVGYEAAVGDTEQKLVTIWERVLQREGIGVRDNFFGLGGHSLKATRLASQVHKELGVKLSLREIFGHPVLRDLARVIDGDGKTMFRPIVAVEGRPCYPLSSAQRRLWILSQQEGGNIAYNIPGVYVFEEKLDPDALEYCLEVLIGRHEILRTVFREDGEGEVRQFILSVKEIDFCIGRRDIRGAGKQDELIRSLVDEEILKAFDLSNGPLLRATLYQAGDNEWIFMYVMHHIISDGWSMGILIRELLSLYHGYTTGQGSILPPLRIHYKDYTLWQNEQLSHGVMQGHKKWWARQFAVEWPVLELPSAKRRPAIKTYNGGIVERHISPALKDRLLSICRKDGATLFMGLLAAVNALLYRYTGQDDIVIGSPIAGRDHVDLEDQVGLYANTLALRTKFGGDMGYRRLLQTVRQVTLGAYEHQLYPFDELVNDLDLKRDMSRNPLFDIEVILQNTGIKQEDKESFGTLKMHEYREAGKYHSPFDMVFNFIEDGEGLHVKIIFNTDIYDQHSVERIAGHLGLLIDDIAEDPEKPIHALQYMSAGERVMILESFNKSSIQYEAGRSVVDLFEKWVERTPDAAATVFGDSMLTYRQLDESANRLASHLITCFDVQAEDLIGVMLDRSDRMIIAILGILKSGAAYVPIDTAYPLARKEHLIKDTGIRILITETNYLFELDYFEGSVFAIDVQLETIEVAAKFSRPAISDSSLAYVIYTSGSTGNPKGVMIEHGQIVNTIFSQQTIFDTTQEDRGLQFASLAFDASIWEIFFMLASGGTLYIIEEERKKNPQLLEQFIVDNGISIATLPPAYLKLLDIHQMGSLKKLITAGEPAIPETALAFASRGIYYNAYGPTESSICASVYKLQEAPDGEMRQVPIGRPLPNTQLYILDDHMGLLPIGATGEICIGGKGLARGYLNRPDLTLEKFVPNPFRIGESIYKTGDLGRYLPDGNIEFAGRKDEQVKINGYRIEPGEIENVLHTHPQIESAIVTVRVNVRGEKELTAYIIGRDRLISTELRSFLSRSLPVYMLPAHFVQLNEWPVTVQGKIDKRKLPDLLGAALASGVEYVAPRNPTEEKLVSIWEDILSKKPIGIRDNFFDAGGHSLKATRLVSQLYKGFEVKIGLKEIFANPVLAEQADLILAAGKVSYIPISKSSLQDDYPLSSSQRRIWLLSQLEENSIVYNISGAFVMSGSLDTAALAYAFEILLQRHEILRTIFLLNGEGEVRQHVKGYAESGFAFRYADFRHKDPEQQTADLLRQESVRSFDLSRGPLIRATLCRQTDQQWVFICTLHHIISDEWSMGMLIDELLPLYGRLCGTDPGHFSTVDTMLSSLNIQYKDYASWQQDQLKSDALALDKDYWLRQFDGELPVLELTGDRERPAFRTYKGGRISRVLDASVTGKLRKLLQAEGGTLFMGLAAAVNNLLFRYTGQGDIIIGTPIAGREHIDLEGQQGLYINTLALRTRFSGTNSFRDLLVNSKAVTLGAYEHQAYPFDELVEALPFHRDAGRRALFDVMVVLQNVNDMAAGNARKMGDIQVNEYKHGQEAISQFDLTFTFREWGETTEVSLAYSADIFDRQTADELAGHFERLLEASIAEPDKAIHSLEFLSVEERHRQLNLLNDTSLPFPSDLGIATLFREQAKKTPAGTALIFDDCHLSYSELDERSDRLAGLLMGEYHVQVGDRVGILLERSEKMIIGILAILKAAAVYVPIDPELPRGRQEFILRDTGAAILLTQSEYIFDLGFFGGIVFAMDIQLDQIDPLLPAAIPDVRPELAYIMYTSGSTGTPKGVMITQEGVIRLVKSANYISLTGDEILLSTGAIGFDATTFEYWATLLNGGTLIICSREDLLDPEQLARIIHDRKVDTIWFTSGWLNQLVDEKITIFQNVKTLLAGGDKLSPVHIASLRNRYPLLQIINGYGPTENTTFSLTYRVDAPVSNIPIGAPISNSCVYILDAQKQLLPYGVMGEIYVGGSGLARGYVNNPELTAAKFLPDPFHAGGRLYRTGDLGRWLPDGNVAFLGRVDEQVKIRGHRVEFGEIEHSLQKYPGVEASAVVTKTITGGEKELVAYIVGRDELSIPDLRDHLKQQLPVYMIPDHFLQLEHLPLTANGKLDRKNLPDPDMQAGRDGLTYIAPRNDIEERLVKIWEEVLGRSNVGVRDNFFDLGGHSLKMTRLASQIHKEFDVKFELRDLFVKLVLEEQAEWIGLAARVSFDAITPAVLQKDYPLSSSQRRLWILSQLAQSNIAYNMSGAFILEGQPDLGALEYALEAVIARHEILRTVFRVNDQGEIRQLVLSPEALRFRPHYTDMRAATDPEEKLRQKIREDMGRAFVLSAGPLLMAGLYQLSDSKWVLSYTMHHIISDGWSMNILMNEILQLYTARVTGAAYPLRPLRIQYKDYASWQQDLLSGGNLQRHKDYWLCRFKDTIPLPELSGDYERPAVKTYRGGVVHRKIGDRAASDLKERCHDQGATLFMGLLTIVNILLYRYTGEEDLVTGSPVAGRGHADLEDQIGFYLNTLALRVEFSGADSFRDLLKNVRQVTMEAYEHQLYPFDELVEALKLERDMSRGALFDVLIDLHDPGMSRAISNRRMGDLIVRPFESGEHVVSKFDLTFLFTDSGEGLGFSLEYNSDLYKKETAERMVMHFEGLVEAICVSPGLPVRQLDYIGEEERNRLLNLFNTMSENHAQYESL